MRTFAATGTCLDCALTLHGAHHCPRCGLLQVGPVASRLHEMLAEADALMRSLDSQRAPINVRPAVTPDKAPTPEPARPVLPPLPEDRPRHEPVSVGSVLLGLGALCLVVAAVVFVVVTWGSMSLSTRTLLLIGATAVAFVAAARLTVRRLHGSVEAVSAVAWLFLIVDVAAARVAGLLGLDALDLTDLATLTGLLMALAASMAAVATHRLVGREPYVTSTVAAVGWWLVGASAAWQWEQSAAWTLVVLVLAGAALSVGYRAVGSLVTGALLAGSTLALHGLLWAEALRTALSADVTALLAGGQLWPVLVAMGLTVAAAEAIRRRHPGERADAVVHGAGLLTTLLGVVVLVVPAWQSAPTHGVTALCLVTVALAATGLLGLRPWTRGPRALAAVSAAGCLLVASPWAAWLCLELAVLVAAPWGHPMDASLDGLRLDTPADSGLPLWTASVGLLTVAVAGWIAASWDAVPLPARVLRGGSVVVVWAVGSLTVSAATASLPVAAASLVLPGLVLVWLAQPGRGLVHSDAAAASAVSGALGLAGGALIASASVGLSLVVWSTCLAATVLMAARSAGVRVAGGWAAVTVVLGVGVVAAVVDLLGAGPGTQALVLAVVLALTLLASGVLPEADLRPGVVAAVAVVSLVPVLLALDVGLARTSLVLTVLGAAAAAVGIADAQRRPSALLGSSVLAIAWWLRLVASDIDVVEAYTLLPAAALLAVGLVPVLRRRAPTVPALVPGLTLALAPSLPLTFADPDSLRGILVLGAAVALLSAGTILRWAAPFLVGAAVVALVAVVHLGPYVGATPRWAALGGLGLAMLVVGVTWESRVHDLRGAVAYVGSLR